MSVTTVETSYANKFELAKRFERKNTKAQLALALARIEEVNSNHEISGARQRHEIEKIMHDVTWGY